MKSIPLQWVAALILPVLAVIPPHDAAAGDAPSGSPPSKDDVPALVRDLGDPSFDRRTAATRRLTAIGMDAADALRAAAAGDEFETARRARMILADLERQWFAGVEVSLAFSEPQVDWDRPVNLIITLNNRGRHEARIPFDATSPLPPAAAEDDAGQVGAFLDVADFLHVVGPDGAEIEARVDDIAADPAVFEAVDRRLNGGAGSTLAPGQRAAFTVPAINRGWARFPMLNKGDYEVHFEYSPEWHDEELTAKHVGAVRSNPAKLNVAKAAPLAVGRSGPETAIRIEQIGKGLIARLTNTADLTTYVNLNFGPAAPFAQGRWIVLRGEEYRESAVGRITGSPWKEFDPAKLTAVAPGETIELARIELTALRDEVAAGGLDPAAGPCLVHFHYSNLCDRKWQQTQGAGPASQKDAPEALRKPLPRRILTATHSSERIELALPR